MARCPAHGIRFQQNPSRAVNQIGATPQPDCRRTPDDFDQMGADAIADLFESSGR
jgi:hypothetical protein